MDGQLELAGRRVSLSSFTLEDDAIARKPDFGDYGINHPAIIEYDPTKMRMSASIRYTGATTYVIAKGRAVDVHGWEQTSTLCAALVRQPEFKGAAFSWGDAYIAERAKGTATRGNPTTWRRVGTTHHLTLVTTELATPTEL